MDGSSPIGSSGAAATYLAQAAAAAAQASSLSAAAQAPRTEAKSTGECESCKVDARSRPLVDQRSQLAAQEAASQSRALERMAAEVGARPGQSGLEDRQQDLQRFTPPTLDGSATPSSRIGVLA